MSKKVGGSRKKPAKPAAAKPKRVSAKLTAARLKKMISSQMDILESGGNASKASVSELLKLLQVYREMTAEQIKEVEVRWVDRLHQDEQPGT
ncbi:MAG: hypothetical protein HYX27_08825 [Acidobacteria bacterium]|nr:hypothetical protein [Acidobacteriota bacterium]